MSEKQAKLLHYFVKLTGDVRLAKAIRYGWPALTHKSKGKLTGWLRRVCATVQALKDKKKLYEARVKVRQAAENLEILKGFVNA